MIALEHTSAEHGVFVPRGFVNTRNTRKPAVIKKPNIRVEMSNEPIDIRYKYACQIDYVHGEIIKRLEAKVGLTALINEVKQLNATLSNSHTLLIHNAILADIQKILIEINYINSGNKLKDYVRETDHLIYQYAELPMYVEYIRFDDDDNLFGADKTTPQETERLNIIEKYFRIAKKYAPVNAVRDLQNDTDCCIICNHSLINVKIDDDGLQKCPRCSSEAYVSTMAGHKGIRSTSSARCYDVVNTFKREYLQYIGEDKVHIGKDVYEELDKYLINQGFPPAEEIRKRPLDVYGKRVGTSRVLLDDALGKIGYPSLYKHVNSIGRALWGWKLRDDLLDKMPLIVQDFLNTQKYFPVIDKGKRTSNMCSQHRLLQHYRSRGIDVPISDFKLPGDEALEASEYMWKQMCQRAGLLYVPLFPEHELVMDRKGFITLQADEAMNVGS